MARDRLAELREEWYSTPDTVPETEEEVLDDEFLALEILMRSRGVTLAGEESVSISQEEKHKKED